MEDTDALPGPDAHSGHAGGDTDPGHDEGHELALQLVAAREDQLRALGEAQRLTDRLERVEAAVPALTRAVGATARLCERLRRAPVNGLHEWFLRTEACACAEREGLRADDVRYLAYVEGAPHEVITKSERTAADCARAVGIALDLDPRAAAAVDLAEVWNATEATNVRVGRVRDAEQVEVERACEALLAPLEGLSREPTPAGAAELLRRILLDGRFRVRGRMARVMAPAVIRLGFGAPHALVGVASHLPDIDAWMREAEDADAFARGLYKAVADGAERTTRAAAELASVREGMLGRLGGQRANARTGQALDAFMRRPVMNVPNLAKAIKATPKGAQLILERLVGGGVVRVLEPDRAKGRLHVCDRALLRQA